MTSSTPTIQLQINKKAPTHAQMQSLLALFSADKYSECEVECKKLIHQYPQHFFAYKLLGATYQCLKNSPMAKKMQERAAEIKPTDVENLSNLATVYKDLGQQKEALRVYEQILKVDPSNASILSKYLFGLNYISYTDSSTLLTLSKRYGQLISQKVLSRYEHWHIHTEKPLRIGLVSSDFLMHPVGFFLENVLANLDSEKIHVTAFSTNTKTDHVTKRLQKHVESWICIAAHSDSEAAQHIHENQIDILIDLTGLSGHQRLGIFAHRPAPLQISWLGYFATTGLPEMDYLLADPVSIGPEHEEQFSEKIIRLPHTRLCYGGTHLKKSGATSSLPALKHPQNKFTFGCFQNILKITDETLQSWSRILKKLPNAQLRMQNEPFKIPYVRKRFTARCKQHGINPEQLQLEKSSGFVDYMHSHQHIDMILDTFPFPGGTTTCEALWMGVPTLTLCGNRMIERQGASLLHAAQMDEWISYSIEEYEEKAIKFAQNLPALANLRSQLREKIAATPLFNAQLFANELTDTLTNLYIQHTQNTIE